MKLRNVLIVAVACFLLPAPGTAGEGSRGGTFLPMGWDARGQALGGAGTILVRDEAAAYWNPANLVFLDGTSAGIGTTKPIPGLNNLYSVISVGTGLLDKRTSTDGEIEVSRLAVALTISHLGLELSQGSGWNEGTLGVSAGFSLNAYNYFGVSWRVMKNWTDVEDAGAYGSSIDLGYTTRLSHRIWLAAMIRDIWSTISYPLSTEQIDPALVLAGSIEDLFGRISAEVDLIFREGEMNNLRLGSEVLILHDTLWLQVGADSRFTNYSRTIPWCGFTAGLGGARLSVAFGFDPEDALGRQTRVTAAYRF